MKALLSAFAIRRLYFVAVFATGVSVGKVLPIIHGGEPGPGLRMIFPVAFLGGLLLLRSDSDLGDTLLLALRTTALWALGWLAAIMIGSGVILIPSGFWIFILALVGFGTVPYGILIVGTVTSAWLAHRTPQLVRWLRG